MSYASYSPGAPLPALRTSLTESEASGLRIGRLDVWPEGILTGEIAGEWVEHSDFDLVIVRYPSADRSFARELRRPGLCSWQADTLLYFCVDTPSVREESRESALVSLSNADPDQIDTVIGQVFQGYINHYRSSPILDSLDVVKSYRAWALAASERPDHDVLVGRDAAGTGLGIVIVDQTSETVSEVLLAGVVPHARQRGVYSSMMRMVAASERLRGAATLAISTQSSNTSVLRAWCRLGFLPEISLDTLHVTRTTSPGLPI